MISIHDRSDIKIRFFNPEFYINEKKQTVTCKLSFRAETPYVIRALINRWLSKTVIATATLKNNDSFDVNVGKKVSLAKAENLAYSHVNELAKTTFKSLCSASDAIVEFGRKTKKVREHNVEYMKKF